jgi:rhodanese-related sulfurtransferase
MFGFMWGRGGKKWEEITPAELQKRMKGDNPPTIIDVREPYEFRQGHIPGAIMLPLGRLQSKLKGLDPGKSYVMVCLSGSRSRQACSLMTQSGIENISNLAGGMGSWDGEIVR